MPKYAYEQIVDMWLVWQRVQVGDGYMYIRVGHVKQVSSDGRPSWLAMDNLLRPVSDKHPTRLAASQAIGITQ